MCPEINQLWKESSKTLQKMSNCLYLTETSPWSLHDIIFCFPQIRKRGTKPYQNMLMLWHSAIVYIINNRRIRVIKDLSEQQAPEASVNIEGWKEELDEELTKSIKVIFAQYNARRDGIQKFKREWPK